jgi:glycosyltransferase involved in cell wall biosynthesis
MEAAVFKAADRVIVTTPAIRQTIIERYGIEPGRVWIIPNYVETERFKPSPGSRQPNLLCFIGRLHEQKNIMALLDAINGLNVELNIIGGGDLQKKLVTKVQEERLKVHFLGNIPNTDLPAYLNRASLFILPSHIEDHPKALLEAMACGLPVIGTDVPGIREVVRHRDTGYLCGTSPREIRASIQDVLGDQEMCDRMGRNAREYVVKHCALETVKEMELELLRELLAIEEGKAARG